MIQHKSHNLVGFRPHTLPMYVRFQFKNVSYLLPVLQTETQILISLVEINNKNFQN